MIDIFAREAARDQVMAASWHRDARRNYEAGNHKEAVRRQLWSADQYAQARAGYQLAFVNKEPYLVFFHEYGRRYGEKTFATFAEACKQLKKYEAMEAVAPRGHALELHNVDNYDYDNSDGLTREERDIVWSREYAEERCAP